MGWFSLSPAKINASVDTIRSGLSNGTKETPLGLLEAMGGFSMY